MPTVNFHRAIFNGQTVGSTLIMLPIVMGLMVSGITILNTQTIQKAKKSKSSVVLMEKRLKENNSIEVFAYYIRKGIINVAPPPQGGSFAVVSMGINPDTNQPYFSSSTGENWSVTTNDSAGSAPAVFSIKSCHAYKKSFTAYDINGLIALPQPEENCGEGHNNLLHLTSLEVLNFNTDQTLNLNILEDETYPASKRAKAVLNISSGSTSTSSTSSSSSSTSSTSSSSSSSTTTSTTGPPPQIGPCQLSASELSTSGNTEVIFFFGTDDESAIAGIFTNTLGYSTMVNTFPSQLVLIPSESATYTLDIRNGFNISIATCDLPVTVIGTTNTTSTSTTGSTTGPSTNATCEVSASSTNYDGITPVSLTVNILTGSPYNGTLSTGDGTSELISSFPFNRDVEPSAETDYEIKLFDSSNIEIGSCSKTISTNPNFCSTIGYPPTWKRDTFFPTDPGPPSPANEKCCPNGSPYVTEKVVYSASVPGSHACCPPCPAGSTPISPNPFPWLACGACYGGCTSGLLFSQQGCLKVIQGWLSNDNLTCYPYYEQTDVCVANPDPPDGFNPFAIWGPGPENCPDPKKIGVGPGNDAFVCTDCNGNTKEIRNGLCECKDPTMTKSWVGNEFTCSCPTGKEWNDTTLACEDPPSLCRSGSYKNTNFIMDPMGFATNNLYTGIEIPITFDPDPPYNMNTETIEVRGTFTYEITMAPANNNCDHNYYTNINIFINSPYPARTPPFDFLIGSLIYPGNLHSNWSVGTHTVTGPNMPNARFQAANQNGKPLSGTYQFGIGTNNMYNWCYAKFTSVDIEIDVCPR